MMLFKHLTFRVAMFAWLLVAGGPPGCAQHRIPAIDPTGQHIFSGTTTFAAHDWLGGGLLHKHQQQTVVPVGPPVIAGPAVAQPPPTKPPCMPPVEAIPVVPMAPPIVAVPQNPLPAVVP